MCVCVCVCVCVYILIKFVTFWIYCLPSIESEVPTLCRIDNSILTVICLVLFCQLIRNACSMWKWRIVRFREHSDIMRYGWATLNYFCAREKYCTIASIKIYCAVKKRTWRGLLKNACLPVRLLILKDFLHNTNPDSSEISPTRCNNCVFILRNGFTLHVSGDNLTHQQE